MQMATTLNPIPLLQQGKYFYCLLKSVKVVNIGAHFARNLLSTGSK